MQKTASKRHRWYIAANLFFVFLLIGHLVSFTNNLRKVNTETQIHEFLVSTDGAKRKVRDYMETSSRTLRDWKKLIGLNDWTAEEIPRKLDDLISSADITAQVLLTDTLRGYSSAAPAGKPGEYGMEYSNTYFSIFQTLTRFRESGRPDDVIITSSFTNPINAETSIAFVTQIETRDESGAAASAFLLYVEPLRALQEVWTAFSEKENAQMSMINTMGDYTYRASMLKNENFYEYLISYNDLTYPQVEALRDPIRMAEEPGWIEYLNSKGQETLHAYSTDSQWGWTLIASIEMKALQVASVQWTILIVSGFTFGMLYLVNSAYFRSLNRQLRSSLTQLEAANSAKTRFLSSMSHDIRTPMNAILGMTAIAEKQLNDRERLEDCLHKIDLAGNHLLTLVNDTLDISQIESGRLTFRPSVFSLEESAADLVNLLYHQAEDKHLRAEVHILDAHQNSLYADKGRLNQIWINLLSNAIKYTPDGGRVDIYLDEKDIPGQPEQVRLTFQVKDTGVGMSQEFQKVLFDSFTRGKDSRIDTIQGSGLGMAITKQLVDLLGGTIQVDSQEGEGSACTVILDLDRAPAPENEGRLDGERILLVGERDLLSAAMQSITRLGGWTDCAPDGERAAGILRAQADAGTPCSLVILDRPMEDRACLEAARAIRRALGPAGPPMVLSAFDVGDIKEDIRETGIRGVVPRPLYRTALTQALDRARHPAESETAPAGPMTDRERLRGVSILVAEDNEINWEIVQELLAMYGARTDRAENGAECVEMVEHAAPGTWQVVLMDMQMPVMGGHGGGQGMHSELRPQGQRLCGQSGPAGGKRAVHAHRPGELLERLPGAPGGGLHPPSRAAPTASMPT